MVVALGPGKFYGKSLPRPRIYTDVKFSEERVDPPVPVTDPLMSWAEEAHWSMGGLSFKRHRLQGRIEGKISKIRAEHEKLVKKLQKNSLSKSPSTGSHSPSPPPAPVAVKRKRRFVDEEEEEEHDGIRKWPARKLGDDFDKVAHESGLVGSDAGETVAARTRGRRAEKAAAEAEVVTKAKSMGMKRLKKGIKGAEKSGNRSSPRLAKRESP